MVRWEMVRLGDILVSQKKSKVKAGDGLSTGKYKFFTSSNIQSKYINSYDFTSEALIFGTGGLASVHYCNELFSTSTDCIVFYKNDDKVYLKFIFLFLYGNIHLLEAGFRGAGLKHISKSFIQNIQAPLPSLEEQKTIAAELDKIQGIIAKRKTQLEKLDVLVKAKFVEMFGDPVTNPMDWEVARLQNVTKSRLGKMLDSKKQTGNNPQKYLANFNVQWFRFDLEQLNEMDFAEKDMKEFQLIKGDLMVCEGGEIGRCAVWNDDMEYCFFQKAIHRVRCDFDAINPHFLAQLFYFKAHHNKFKDIVGSHATIPHLTGEKIKIIPVFLPPIELQNQFAEYVQKVEKLKSTMHSGLEKLELLYKSKMQEYFG